MEGKNEWNQKMQSKMKAKKKACIKLQSQQKQEFHQGKGNHC